jgi:deaminated glutathione amidase
VLTAPRGIDEGCAVGVLRRGRGRDQGLDVGRGDERHVAREYDEQARVVGLVTELGGPLNVPDDGKPRREGGDRTSAGRPLLGGQDAVRQASRWSDDHDRRGSANCRHGTAEQGAPGQVESSLVDASETPSATAGEHHRRTALSAPFVLLMHLSILASLAPTWARWQTGRMRAAVVQFAATTDVVANIEAIGPLVRDAGRQGADLIVVPEGAMHDFGQPDLPLGRVAQTVDGPFATTIAELARETGALVVAGMFERSDDAARPFNTLVAFGPAGDLVATYRKTYLYDSFGYRESERLSRGDGSPVTVKTGEFTLGLMTCYDLRFPELARGLVDVGADVFVIPAAWVRGTLKEDHWSTLLRARAIENTCFAVAAGQAGSMYIGCSMVVDPMGVRLSSLGGDEEGVAVAEVSVERLAAARRRNPSLENRR